MKELKILKIVKIFLGQIFKKLKFQKKKMTKIKNKNSKIKNQK